MALLTLLLSCSLVVASPGPAEALVKPPVIDGERLLGGVVKTGKGVGRFGRIVPGPVGAILTVGSLAWWAYDSYDTKVHAPQPGGDASDWLGGAAAYPSSFNDGMVTATVTSVSGRTVTMEVNCSGWLSIYNGALFKCGDTQNGEQIAVGTPATTTVKETDCVTAAGVHTIRPLVGLWSRSAWTDPAGTGAVTVSQTGMGCNTNETVAGFRLLVPAPRVKESSRWFQIAAIGWGTMAGTTLPEGQLTFQTAVIDVTCRNASTGATEHLLVTSQWGEAETLDLPSCKQRLGDEWYGVGVKVIPMDPEIDDLPLDPEIWPDWDVPDFMPEEWSEDLTPEEEAEPCHGTKTGCGLTINIDGEPVYPGTTTRTKIDTLTTNEPSRVTCKWGTKTVDWKWCIPLLPTFEPGSGGSTTTDPTKPDTGTGTPTTGTGTQPVPTEGQNCIKAAFSWNPVDWVFVPVKCALQWAFKPTTAFSTRIGRVKTAFENKPPFSWLLTLGDLPPISGGGCPTNWQWTYKDETYPILCGTAMGNGLHAFRPTMVVLLVGAAVYPFLRALVYASFPIVKPVPHD